MKISYFFNISAVIGRSDMKQKAKKLLRSMLSCPFIYDWILAHTFFLGVTIFFGWVGLLIDFSRSDPPIHPSATFEDSNVHTSTYFYISKKLKMSTFVGYLYKKKPFRALKTPVHPYTRTPSSARAPHIMCHVLSF